MTRDAIFSSSEPLVYCIVLNWNGWRDTIACLESLESIKNSSLSVLVVDNGSSDDSISRIRQAFPSVEILETHQNLGFGGGNNRGIQVALDRDAKYIWLLNNDTTVTSNTLNALVSTAEADPRLGQIGSVLYYMNQPDQLQAWGGGRVNLWTGRTFHYYAPVRSEELDYLTAASVFLRAEVLREIGLLDQVYFMYWEDTDLSYRIRAAGWKLDVATDAVVYHKESASSVGKSPKLDRYMTASGARFLKKFAPLPWMAIMIMISGRVAKRILSGEWRRGWAVIAGLWGYPKAEAAR